MREVVLVIPDAAPGLNRMMRMHWAKRVKEVARWKRLVWAARCQVLASKPAKPTGKVRVEIERRSPWLLDPDNADGSAKHIVDALKDQNLIADDTTEHIELSVTQAKGPPQTTIRVLRLEAA